MERIPPFLTPAIGNRFSGWRRILRFPPQRRIDPSFRRRVFSVGAVTLLSTPFQWFEDLRLARKIRSTVLHPAPVFIIGHWRSGTTFLHNLLSRDPQFACVTTVQSVFPHSFATNPLFPWLTKVLMPPTRPMDDMRLYMQSPQEEEMALVNYGPCSFYHAWHFPQAMRFFYRRTVKFEGVSDRDWSEAYLSLLRKTTFLSGQRRLLLKNPANTGRLRTLLKLFPEAKFIFIYRDPLEVYASTQKLYRNVLPIFQLQAYDFENIKRDIIWIYKDLMTTYLRQRALIPEGQLYEVAHHSLSKMPMEKMEVLYEALQLGDFTEVAPHLEAYLRQRRIKNFRKSTYDIPASEVEILEKEWAFAFENWK